MIQSVFDLGDTRVREVMVPRTEMVWIEQEKSVRQALALALRSGYSRVPVIGENVDDTVGVVYLKDLVRRTTERSNAARSGAPAPDHQDVVGEVMRPAAFVPDSCAPTRCCAPCSANATTWPSSSTSTAGPPVW